MSRFVRNLAILAVIIMFGAFGANAGGGAGGPITAACPAGNVTVTNVSTFAQATSLTELKTTLTVTAPILVSVFNTTESVEFVLLDIDGNVDVWVKCADIISGGAVTTPTPDPSSTAIPATNVPATSTPTGPVATATPLNAGGLLIGEWGFSSTYTVAVGAPITFAPGFSTSSYTPSGGETVLFRCKKNANAADFSQGEYKLVELPAAGFVTFTGTLGFGCSAGIYPSGTIDLVRVDISAGGIQATNYAGATQHP